MRFRIQTLLVGLLPAILLALGLADETLWP
jgi:hypothetical protein